MKTIRPALIAAAMLLASAAAAQTPRPDSSADAEGADSSIPDSATERASTTGGTRTEPNEESRDILPSQREGATEFDRERDQLSADVTEVKTEVEDLRANSNDKGREKLDSLSQRVDDLEKRTVAASSGSERDFNENKHKYKNELKKIRRELKDASKYRITAPPAMPPMDAPYEP